ncbi:hypothetical protein [Streptomyces sp. NPDC051162]|uniref:hypothetical protein n=1 Tax=unclassified Streptomyces TaxID=2593676 RepID=UPI003433D439
MMIVPLPPWGVVPVPRTPSRRPQSTCTECLHLNIALRTAQCAPDPAEEQAVRVRMARHYEAEHATQRSESATLSDDGGDKPPGEPPTPDGAPGVPNPPKAEAFTR